MEITQDNLTSDFTPSGAIVNEVSIVVKCEPASLDSDANCRSSPLAQFASLPALGFACPNSSRARISLVNKWKG